MLVYRSFAFFETSKTFNILEGKVPNFTKGDITLAVLVDGVKQDSFPDKNGHKYVGYDCNNDATVDVTYDNEISKWKVDLSTTDPTICTLKFESYTSRNLVEALKESGELVTFTHEDTEQTGSNTNIDYRYTGKDPNNYVLFNDELWRIIGIFNTDDGTGKYEERVKLVKAKHIGEIAIDEENKNNWVTSSLNNLLNNGDYYNRVGLYYENGLKEESRNMINNAKWYLGGHDGSIPGTYLDIFNEERDNKVFSGNPKNWIGKVALIYLSDYGFIMDKSCLSILLNDFENHNICAKSNWILTDNISENETYRQMWTLSVSSTRFYHQYLITPNGTGITEAPQKAYLIRPSVYLKFNILTTNGTGTKDNPYILTME